MAFYHGFEIVSVTLLVMASAVWLGRLTLRQPGLRGAGGRKDNGCAGCAAGPECSPSGATRVLETSAK